MKQRGASLFSIVIGALLLLTSIGGHPADKVAKPAKGAKGTKPALHWTYSGKTGPEKWSDLEKDFEKCSLGQFQSPIDIPDATTRKGDFPDLLFVYKPSPLRIVDNGHTIQVDYAPGSTVTVDGHRYELVQFHFHRPSEEKIDGRGHDMVIHLVHKDAGGKLAVLAVLLDRGTENPAIATLWENLPKGKEKEAVVPGTTINAVDLLPNDKGYYSFTGSLTTPPCSEDVTWFVLKSPIQLSAEQVARFEKIYPMNARPVQPVNGRDIMATR
jgi:carbonic anhydrase